MIIEGLSIADGHIDIHNFGVLDAVFSITKIGTVRHPRRSSAVTHVPGWGLDEFF